MAHIADTGPVRPSPGTPRPATGGADPTDERLAERRRFVAAVLLSTALGALCFYGAPFIGLLAAGLVELLVGLFTSPYPLQEAIKIAGAPVAGVMIGLVINGIVFGALRGRFPHWRLFAVNTATAAALYLVILAVRALTYDNWHFVFFGRGAYDDIPSFAATLFLVYGPLVGLGYAAVFWGFHRLFRPRNTARPATS